MESYSAHTGRGLGSRWIVNFLCRVTQCTKVNGINTRSSLLSFSLQKEWGGQKPKPTTKESQFTPVKLSIDNIH